MPPVGGDGRRVIVAPPIVIVEGAVTLGKVKGWPLGSVVTEGFPVCCPGDPGTEVGVKVKETPPVINVV